MSGNRPDSDIPTDPTWPPGLLDSYVEPTSPLASKATLGEMAYAMLLSYEGQHEEGGENQGAIVARMNGPWTAHPLGKPWCAGAACTSYLESGSEAIKVIGGLSCGAVLRALKAERMEGTRIIEQSEARQGDLVFVYSWGKPFHMGLYDHASSNIAHDVILAGNARDKVAKQRYERNTDGSWSTHDGEKRLLVFARIER